METTKQIILFDGVCNLCNNAVQFVIKRDKKDVFRYAALQSEVGQQLTKERGIDTSKVDSIILIDPGTAYYTTSTAALEIGKKLKGYRAYPPFYFGYRLLYVISYTILLPKIATSGMAKKTSV